MKRYIALTSLLACSIGFSATHLLKVKDLQRSLGVRSYVLSSKVQRALPSIKIAVLDNGFGDLGSNFNKVSEYLPASTQVVEYYPKNFIERYKLNPSFKGNPMSTSQHGLMMAQMIWSLTGSNSEGPSFYLLNANGFTNFTRAVKFAIEKDVDIILYSQNWEYGGNFDGKGFINKVVNEATDSGILWINAAGNYAGKVWNSKISQDEGSSFLELKNGRNRVEFEVGLDENSSTLTVAWQDFSDDLNTAAESDLDVQIVNAQGKVFASSELSQVQLGASDKRKSTLYAREKLTFNLDKGKYYVQLKHMAGNFNKKNVRLYLNSDHEAARFTKLVRKQEIMIPADNPNVITIGDNSKASAIGPTLDGRSKPEIIMPVSMAEFSNGLTTSGTSNAAAFYAGVVALALADNEDLKKSDLVMNSTGFEPVVKKVSRRKIPREIRKALGSVYNDIKVYLLESGRLKIVLPMDPEQLTHFFPTIQIDMNRSGLSFRDYDYFIGTNANSVRGYYQPKGWNNTPQTTWLEVTGPSTRTVPYRPL